MSDRPLGDEIDQELRKAMSDVAAVPGPAPELDELFSPTLTLEGERTMKTNTRTMLIAAAAAIVAVVIGIILFAPTDDGALDTIDSPDETTTTLPGPDPASAEVDAPSVEPAAPSAEDLLGVWETRNLDPQQTWTVVASGILVENGFVESHTYTATDTTIELTDSDCGVLVPGTYGWEIVDDVLTLTVVEDECGRSGTLDGATFERLPSAADLLGVWQSTNLGREQTWTVRENRIEIVNGFISLSIYSATESTIEFKDTSCGFEMPGTYEWVIIDDVLTITVVDDACSRSDTLNGAMFERVS